MPLKKLAGRGQSANTKGLDRASSAVQSEPSDTMLTETPSTMSQETSPRSAASATCDGMDDSQTLSSSPERTNRRLLLPAGVKPYYLDEQSGIAIFCADCREILPLLPDKSVDLVLPAPPYGHNNNDGDLIHNREKALGRGEPGPARPIPSDGPEANELVRFLFAQADRLLDKGCCCCCCCGGGGGPDPQFARWSLWMDELLGFKMCVVWDKGGLGMGWHYRRNWECVLVSETSKWNGGLITPNVVRFPKIIPQETHHPTEKPVELMAFFARLHSDPGEIVLDPFMGSGTTLVAARSLGRKCIGIEIEERYCEIAVHRLRQQLLNFPEQLRGCKIEEQGELYGTPTVGRNKAENISVQHGPENNDRATLEAKPYEEEIIPSGKVEDSVGRKKRNCNLEQKGAGINFVERRTAS